MRECYFRDYQTQRSILLSLGILISLNGCMLESNDSTQRDAFRVKYRDYSSELPEVVFEETIDPDSIDRSEEANNINFDQIVDYFYNEQLETEKIQFDLDRIRERKKLIALTGCSYSSYFIYKGTPMGYEYELLNLLAKHLGVELEIIIVNDFNQIFEMLNRGDGDIIADNLTITKERDELVDFTIPHNLTKQVLIQRKPANWRCLPPDKLEKRLIRNPIDLIGKEVHVRRESSYYARLNNLSDEVGGPINIIEAPGDAETEELILNVALGKIPFTVADENIALLNKPYYPDIDIATPISFPQQIGWAVRSGSPQLLKAVNDWIKKMKTDPVYYSIYDKYYNGRRGVEHMVTCSKTSSCGRTISPYDNMIAEHAKELGWDWRLLASLIYQESHFDPNAKSWVGACGLMQLMPATAEIFGAKDLNDPIQSLKAGTKYIKWLDNYWKSKVPDRNERIKFIMASYNVGQEHVADAQRLAIKYHKDPKRWDNNVAFFILQKSKQQYCNDPVVKYGYCRGSEPFNYVNEILDRYEHYKKLIQG